MRRAIRLCSVEPEPGSDLCPLLAGCRRFIINAPKDDLEGGCRILFVVETAWWFYEDNFRDKNP
eukprot:COSAG01_NODE_12549_length_1721_cov_9.601110_1_plen_63_part_10